MTQRAAKPSGYLRFAECGFSDRTTRTLIKGGIGAPELLLSLAPDRILLLRGMRQAAKAASDYKREEYLAAALSALVVTGVVASKLMANLEGKKAAAPGPARKKRKTKAK